MQINENWEYQQFDTLFDWCEKSKIKSGAGKQNGKYKMFVCSDTDVKYYDEYLQDSEALVFGTGGKASCHYVNGKFAYSTDCIVAVKSSNELLLKFYYYFLRQQNMKLIQETFTGSGLEHTSKKKIGQLLVPVPSLPEQQRIVAKIEELFAELDNSVAMLKKVKEQINQYNESVMEQIFQQSDCSWEEYKLGDEKICSINKNFDLPDFEDEEIVSFLPMAAVEAKTNKFYPQTTTYRKVKKGYTKFRNGDILFAKITPCMENGKICIVNDLIKDCGFGSTEFHVLRCSENLLPKFLYYFVSREHFLRRAVPYMTGSVGQKRMPADYLAEQKIKVPSINVQKQIINDVENKISKSKSIDNILDSVLVNCDALRQSILKKAFGGEL